MIQQERRIVSIDALRGIAALSVVFWHWQHFLPSKSPDQFPLYWLLWPLYDHGRIGVDLFFCVSGFVFFTLYADRISERNVSAARFTMLRFSRLYPLHFLTLIAVVCLQAIFYAQTSRYFIYSQNSLGYFGLQLILASNWWPSHYSFNGPIWSVSIEVLLYVCFFILMRLRLRNPLILAAIALTGLWLIDFNQNLGRGVFSFFQGCICAIIYFEIRIRSVSAITTTAATAVLLGSIAWKYPAIPTADELLRFYFCPFVLCAAALIDQRFNRVIYPLEWLGYISYSSYLLHFPMQLVLVTFLVTTGTSVDFSSPITLVLFFAALIFCSLASFTYLEQPVMQDIRRMHERQTLKAKQRHESELAFSAPLACMATLWRRRRHLGELRRRD